MRVTILSVFIACLGAGLSRALTGASDAAVPCTLTATGGDDAPQFLSAVKACATVTIPKTTTLNIATRLNMTGLADKHIVSCLSPPDYCN